MTHSTPLDDRPADDAVCEAGGEASPGQIASPSAPTGYRRPPARARPTRGESFGSHCSRGLERSASNPRGGGAVGQQGRGVARLRGGEVAGRRRRATVGLCRPKSPVSDAHAGGAGAVGASQPSEAAPDVPRLRFSRLVEQRVRLRAAHPRTSSLDPPQRLTLLHWLAVAGTGSVVSWGRACCAPCCLGCPQGSLRT